MFLFSILIATKKIEKLKIKYSKIEKINRFVDFLSTTANWLCFVKEDFEKLCFIHRFLIKVENIQNEYYENKEKIISKFWKLAEEKQEVFMFINDFFYI